MFFFVIMLLFIFSLVFLLHFSETTSCNVRESRCVSCKNVSTFPTGNELVYVLKITHSYLFTIPENVFMKKKLIFVKVAILPYNNIKKISNGSFNGLSNLILLDLTGNNLEELEMNFENVPQLKILCLANNQLRYIHSNTFQHLDKLSVLDVFQNKIATIDGNFLRPLHSIEYLDLSCNCFDASRTFLTSNTLKFLRISLNNFTQHLFKNVNNLEMLDLWGSSIKNINEKEFLHLNIRALYADSVLVNWNQLRVIPKIDTLITYNVSNMLGVLELTSLLNFATSYNNYLDLEMNKYVRVGFPSGNTLHSIQSSLLFVLLVYLSILCTLLFIKILNFITRPKNIKKMVYE